MASKNTTETGIRVNLGNFSKILDSVQALGVRYQPAEPSLSSLSLGNLFSAAAGKTDAAEVLSKEYHKARADRALLFEGLCPLSTRVVNALDILKGVSEGVKKEATAINRKIQGSRAPGSKAPVAEGAVDNSHSTSQRGFVNLAGHLRGQIALLGTIPQYTPSEAALSIASLSSLAAQLEAANDAVSKAYMPYSNAKAERNALFNLAGTGLVELAGDIKKYYKAAFGAGSPEYRQISSIFLRKITG